MGQFRENEAEIRIRYEYSVGIRRRKTKTNLLDLLKEPFEYLCEPEGMRWIKYVVNGGNQIVTNGYNLQSACRRSKISFQKEVIPFILLLLKAFRSAQISNRDKLQQMLDIIVGANTFLSSDVVRCTLDLVSRGSIRDESIESMPSAVQRWRLGKFFLFFKNSLIKCQQHLDFDFQRKFFSAATFKNH